ncbi:MAG: hypothetical protein ACT4ON_00990 [Bacteroidota bacterium]
MQPTTINKAILAVACVILLGMLYNIFFGQAKLKDAYKKIEEVQIDLVNIKINLNQSVKQIDSVVTKLNTSESSLNVIRKQVEIIDTKYELSKEKSRTKIDSLKNEAEKQDEELEKLKKAFGGN